jgi:hypothetical protein
MPSQSIPVIDLKTGQMTPEWYAYFVSQVPEQMSALINRKAMRWNDYAQIWEYSA